MGEATRRRASTGPVDNLIDETPEEKEAKSELELLREQVEQLKQQLATAVMMGVVKAPQPSILTRMNKPDPPVKMRLMDKGVGKVATGENSGFARYTRADFGVVFEAPMSGARHLWNRDYATPVDRSVIPLWEKENERERFALMTEKERLNKLLDRVDYYGNVRAPETIDQLDQLAMSRT